MCDRGDREGLAGRRSVLPFAMLWIGSIVWGVQDLRRAVAFWTAALDHYPMPDDPLDGDWVLLKPRSGHGVQLALQGVQALLEYGRGLNLPEVFWFLTSDDSFLRELAGALGMAPVQRAYFEKVAVDVYSLKLGAGVDASAPTPGLSAVKKN